MQIIMVTNIYFILNFGCNSLVTRLVALLGISDIFLEGVYMRTNHILACT